MTDAIFGLITKEEVTVPLMGVEATGTITGQVAKVKVKQHFENQEDRAVEAVYKFPLPENSSVCGFNALIGEKIVKGVIEEKEKAFKVYDEALTEGHGAYLLDEERPNIFTLSVGNLNPRSSAIIEIDYILFLDANGREARFSLPTTISPRYVPADTDEVDGIPVHDIVNPPVSADVPYGLRIFFDIMESGSVSSVESPSHAIKTRFDKNSVNVELTSENTEMNRDFVLTIEYKHGFENRGFVCQQGDEGFIQLDFSPGMDEVFSESESGSNGNSGEVVFVLDCSGSMNGSSIAEAKKALEACLKGMSPGMAFDIYRFGSTFECLFGSGELYTEKSLGKALAYLRETDADLGGTEALAPLEAIYKTKPLDGRTRSIVFITDGEISNERLVIDLVRNNVDTTSVFTVGIGHGPNEYLVKRVAAVTGGATEMIAPGERIEPRILRLFKKVTKGRIEDFEIAWGSDVEQSPFSPAMFMEQCSSVFARIKHADKLPETLVVTGKAGDASREWTIDLKRVSGDTPIPLIWARERIRDLEEGIAVEAGSRQLDRKQKLSHETVVDISRKYGLISRETSYVAVETRTDAEKTTGEVVLRKIPIMLTMGWHGIGYDSSWSMSVTAPSQEKLIASMYCLKEEVRDDRHELLKDSAFLRYPLPTRTKVRKQKRKPAANLKKEKYKVTQESSRDDLVLHMLSLQKTTGGFEIDQDFARILGYTMRSLREMGKNISTKGDEDKYVILSTSIVLAVLERDFADKKDYWGSVVEKSNRWLLQIGKRKGLLSILFESSPPVINGMTLSNWTEAFLKGKQVYVASAGPI